MDNKNQSNEKKDPLQSFLDQAANSIAVGAAKLEMEKFKDFVPVITDCTKCMYDDMKQKGFTDKQAFDFASEYTMRQFIQDK